MNHQKHFELDGLNFLLELVAKQKNWNKHEECQKMGSTIDEARPTRAIDVVRLNIKFFLLRSHVGRFRNVFSPQLCVCAWGMLGGADEGANDVSFMAKWFMSLCECLHLICDFPSSWERETQTTIDVEVNRGPENHQTCFVSNLTLTDAVRHVYIVKAIATLKVAPSVKWKCQTVGNECTWGDDCVWGEM